MSEEQANRLNVQDLEYTLEVMQGRINTLEEDNKKKDDEIAALQRLTFSALELCRRLAK